MIRRAIAILGGVLMLGIPLFSQDFPLPQSNEEGIVYGTSVSRNEFGIEGGVFISPDRTRQAVYRKDESAVQRFPFLDITKPGGALKPIRYPMAGCASEKISVGVYDLSDGNTVYLSTEDEYKNPAMPPVKHGDKLYQEEGHTK